MKRSIQSILDTDIKSHRTYFTNKNIIELITKNNPKNNPQNNLTNLEPCIGISNFLLKYINEQ